MTPLHSGLKNYSSKKAMKMLVKAQSDAIKKRNEDGVTPLKLGLDHDASAKVVKILFDL